MFSVPPWSRVLMVLLALAVAFPLGSVLVAADPPTEEATEYIVRFYEMPRDVQQSNEYQGGQVKHRNEDLRYAVVETHNANQFERSARQDENVRSIVQRVIRTDALLEREPEPSTGDPVLADPTDPSFSTQYGPQRIGAPAAWDTTFGDTGKTICIVDTGIRYTHEDLTGSRYLGGTDTWDDDADPWDDAGHGTHVAGTAAATTNNGVGVAGISQAGILAARAIGATGASADSLADGVQWCADQDADVISMSWRWPAAWGGQDLIRTALENAAAEGILLVAAAGNDGCNGCINFPADMPEVIAVTCTTSTGAVCGFSSTGADAELSAPGNAILSTCFGSDSDYCSLSGTSMSTPHVSGAAALVWSYAPSLTSAQVRQVLTASAEDLGAAGRDDAYGFGEVDVAAALAQATTRPLSDRFDDGSAPGWTLSGLWHVTTRRSNTAIQSLWYGQESSGNFDTGGANSGTATHAAVLVPDLDPKVALKSWHQTESGLSFDKKFVEVSSNAGASWTTLTQLDTAMSRWNTHHFNLGPFAGALVLVRVRFESVDGIDNGGEGWYLDDVQITGTQAPGGGGGIALNEDFDDGAANGWTLSGFWHVTNRRPSSSPNSLWYGRDQTGTYDNGAANSGEAITPLVAVPSGNPKLTFQSWYSTESGTSFDQKLVHVSTNGGSTWTLMTQISDTMAQWNAEIVDLAAFAGQNIHVRFRFDTIDSIQNNMEGWYIDDVVIGSQINGVPTACFAVSPTTGTTATSFSVDATCSTDDGGTAALQVRWDWESDGSWDTAYSTGKAASHVFGSSGTKTIRVEAKDAGGQTDTDSRTVLVNNPPTACFGVSPSSGNTGTTFFFDSSCSSDDLTPSGNLEVRWDFDNDGWFETGFTTTKTESFWYGASGTWTARVEVRDAQGSIGTTTRSILVNDPPNACFTASPAHGMVATTFQFDAGCSWDDLTPTSSLEVRWDFENDGSWDTGFSTSKTTSKQYTSLGSKTVRLEVRDWNGATSQTTRAVTVHVACVGATCVG